MRRLMAACAVILAALSGCAGESSTSSSSQPTGTDPPTSSGADPSPTETPGPQPEVPALLLEGCKGTFLGLWVPEDLVDPYVPDPFDPTSIFPGQGQLNIVALRCPRLTAGHEVLTDVMLVLTLAMVDPDASDWDDAGVSYYVFETFTNNQSAAQAFRQAGLPVEEATLEATTTVVADEALEEWTISNDQATLVMRFPHPVTATQPEPGKLMSHLWSDTNPYNRTDGDLRYVNYRVTENEGPMEVEMEGALVFREMLGTPVATFGQSPVYDTRLEIPIEPKVFVE